jgi:2-(1,2-epoxy-1,2-dihydrophenyl)acetyl-CoA isomerase
MVYEHILLEQNGGTAWLTLNRPQTLNAMNRRLFDELLHALDRLTDAGTARVLVITGAGRAFCSGADLSPNAWEGESVDAAGVDAGRILETHVNPLIERLGRLPLPVVTAVNGAAAGAGCSLALFGDIVLAARSATFVQAFVNIGLVPDGGSTWLLPRVIGRPRAQAMMMLGDRIDAEQAEAWGMIYRCVADEDLIQEATKLAARLASGPTVAYGLIRKGVRAALNCGLTEALALERRHQLIAGQTQDFTEGVAAFRDRRPPRFEGR